MEFLDLAARLASEVDWRDVCPNPRVGCVIVRDGEVLSIGVHTRYGEAHAEQKALEGFFKSTKYKVQSTKNELEVYITLEPCDDFPGKKTESCTQKLINIAPKKVVIGAIDKRFGGKNVEKLRAAGIKVEVQRHVLSQNLARVRPHIILKLAQTLDGKISKGGENDIISSLESRKKVHQLRSEVDAILTTTKTLSSDNPLLDCRFVNKKSVPQLLVFGNTSLRAELLVFQNPERKITQFTGKDLFHDMREISEMGVKTVLTECGATIATSLLQHDLVDEIWMFLAPQIQGKGTPVFTTEVPLKDFSFHSVEISGGDVLMKFIKE